jgi:phage tail sheath protein FI
MAVYLHPGVYVEEVPSSVHPIAGVGTSTAGFIGIVPDTFDLPEVTNVLIGVGNGTATTFPLPVGTIDTTSGTFAFRVGGTPDTGASLHAGTTPGSMNVTLSQAPAAGVPIRGDYTPQFTPAPAGRPQLCTTFSDFTSAFGPFSADAGHANLAQAVYGFFANGGTRCYVSRETATANIAGGSLAQFETIDEIAIVAAPGIADHDVWAALTTHCAVRTQDRFAIFDIERDLGTGTSPDLTLLSFDTTNNVLPPATSYGAVYFPWIQVANPIGTQPLWAPPSGHVAGIYARVDTQRGVHKAPANEPVMSATGLRYGLSDAQQDGLNPQGVNAIRLINDAFLVWGARTLGGDQNSEWKYINVRRLLLYIRKSIYRGTGWVVFEPNDASLWAKIVRNVTAFLTDVWRDGALFGAKPGDAFYVKCDAETNPQSVIAAGQVVTEIGLAVTQPAEFVIFRISQGAGLS